MKIFPKISEGQIPDRMKEIISTKEGIEIQFFDEAGPTESFNFEEQVTRRKEEFPNLKEIIIHPPLNNYNIEFLLLKGTKQKIPKIKIKNICHNKKTIDKAAYK